ncbi:bll1541 [Bradyrhizobium diazoefficiens USDA 110]|uniref:Bll1541 protein n=2 Tax=Bradyrhizobium TaxID=374 RepID=Q89U76_BRADU|nr:hypothetical protein CIT37_05765 [Bradyrhizobium ottawaense]PDT59443.1 hypothetical protein CO678_22710 [Bradyrhizobium diazoefficiens]QBP26979.1 hypothetical protein Bdiaspc4_07770 [Bradyrhizobium diazoefficiens]BAC46806.1 bll1541 [Bradyrhizobium diazoefficiens USDA 110]
MEHRDTRKLSFSLTAAAVNMIGPTITQIETSVSTPEANVKCGPSVISVGARPRLTKDVVEGRSEPEHHADENCEISGGCLPARSTLRITEAGAASDHSPAIALGDNLR